MELQNREKQRALNILWNASGDYSLRFEREAYDAAGKANLYWNFIIGAVHQYYDYPQLQRFFADLKADPDFNFYESLTWIGLENCTYQTARKHRPVLAELRRSYALQVFRKEDRPSLYYLVNEIKTAHFQRALGEEPEVSDQVITILNDLEFEASVDTEQIIRRMKQIIAIHFPTGLVNRNRKQLKTRFLGIIRLHLNHDVSLPFGSAFLGSPLFSLFRTDSVGRLGENGGAAQPGQQDRRANLWQKLKDRADEKREDCIQSLYGVSILTDTQTRALEQVLCVGNHKNCHLHFTRGEFFGKATLKMNGKDPQEVAQNQAQKNRKHYQKNLARNNTSIVRLANIIKNTMLVYLETSTCRSKIGKLDAGKVWRNIYLSDDKVFYRNVSDDIGNLSVDVLLDASGSQIDRQEMIASQGYIIAESLTRCRIPVRVCSFCTRGTYTVLHLFREYGEANRNERILNYRASGCNRDGLAIRTLLHQMEASRCDHKILIVLSDGKPVDPQGVADRGRDPDLSYYADALGVNETAFEVRKGRQNGVSILCVYTGLEDDLQAAKKIYGNDLVWIKSPERFADMVGVLLTNKLRNG